MTQTIEQLTARVRELEADLEFQTNARIQDRKDAETNYKNWNAELKKQLAAEQLNNKLLRKALEAVIKVHGYESGIPVEALSLRASIEALDAYVLEKLKESKGE